jgi:hypothetical protein
VVVGVDPRWLNNALSEKYKNLFGAHYASESAVNQDDIAKTALSGAATSYDYLEKIFQIPFSLRQINSTGRKNLIKYLLRNEMQPEPVVPEVEQTTEKPTETETENLNASPPDKFIALPKNVIAEEDKVPEIIEEHKERLTFLKEEMECMQQMSVLFGQSPRTINRFINIYRIIKAHGKLKVSDEFSENDYAPIMLVLSIIVGFSTEAQDFINKLSKFDDNAQFIEFLTGQGYPQTFVDQILASMKPSVDELPVKAFKDNLELISRFSFRTFAVSVEKNTGE